MFSVVFIVYFDFPFHTARDCQNRECYFITIGKDKLIKVCRNSKLDLETMFSKVKSNFGLSDLGYEPRSASLTDYHSDSQRNLSGSTSPCLIFLTAGLQLLEGRHVTSTEQKVSR